MELLFNIFPDIHPHRDSRKCKSNRGCSYLSDIAINKKGIPKNGSWYSFDFSYVLWLMKIGPAPLSHLDFTLVLRQWACPPIIIKENGFYIIIKVYIYIALFTFLTLSLGGVWVMLLESRSKCWTLINIDWVEHPVKYTTRLWDWRGRGCRSLSMCKEDLPLGSKLRGVINCYITV